MRAEPDCDDNICAPPGAAEKGARATPPVMSRASAAGGGRCGVPSVTSARTPACGAPGVAGGESKPSGSPTKALPSHPPAECPSRVTCIGKHHACMSEIIEWHDMNVIGRRQVTCAQPLSRLALSTVSRTLFKYHLHPSAPHLVPCPCSVVHIHDRSLHATTTCTQQPREAEPVARINMCRSSSSSSW